MAAVGIAAACAELVGRLKAAGFASVDVDSSLIGPDPVCVWVNPRQVSEWTLPGGSSLLVWVYLIAGNVETPDALALLDTWLSRLLEVCDPADSDPVVDLSAPVILPGNPHTALPAFRVAVDLEL